MYTMSTNDRCVLCLVFCVVLFGVTEAMQCYTCKGSATNEVDANIRCLASSNLEDCDHFYEYYDMVETDGAPSPPSYEFYDYGPDDNVPVDSGAAASRAEARDNPKKHRRVRAADESSSTNASLEAAGADDKYEYEYYDSDTSKVVAGTTMTSLSSRKTTMPKMVKIKEPEHYCYSTTTKTAWESYVVEKGCMRIKYCHDRKASLNEWNKPWNFCCKRSRCNAKLVEDKPQRVFGMGCRRTEDCVQGHNNRPVCANYFKSCPHISTGIIKMECRLQPRRPAVTGRSVAAFRQSAPLERRCFCVRNAYPKGPVCMSTAAQQCPTRHQLPTLVMVCWLLLRQFLGELLDETHW